MKFNVLYADRPSSVYNIYSPKEPDRETRIALRKSAIPLTAAKFARTGVTANARSCRHTSTYSPSTFSVTITS